MPIPQETLVRIIRSAVRAPSGDNSQPWKFTVLGDSILFHNVPEADTSPFNFKQASNYMAIGAALENAQIAAEAEGFATKIELFPNMKDEPVARLQLQEGSTKENWLAAAIELRASNRHKYFDKPLPPDALERIRACVRPEENTRLSLMTDALQVRRIGELVSAGERITLENRPIHSFLFKHVTWNPEDDAKRHGFYIKTFEFKPPQEAAFRLFSHWNILRFFHPFGVTRAIARDQARVYGASAAFGAIKITELTPEAFIRAGMLLERVWLTTASLGIALQPTSSVPLLSVALSQGGGAELSGKHVRLVQERASSLSSEFGLNAGEHFVFAFRLGYAPEPRARTSRSEPQITYA